MRLYVIGPVTGREGLNRAAFEAAKDELWGAGYDVLIPHDVVPSNATYSVAMRLSIKTLLGCDGVALLIDWDESTGATLEKRVAEVCGIETHYVRAWLRLADDCPENDKLTRGNRKPAIRRRENALRRGSGRAHPPHGRDERAFAGGLLPDWSRHRVRCRFSERRTRGGSEKDCPCSLESSGGVLR